MAEVEKSKPKPFVVGPERARDGHTSVVAARVLQRVAFGAPLRFWTRSGSGSAHRRSEQLRGGAPQRWVAAVALDVAQVRLEEPIE